VAVVWHSAVLPSSFACDVGVACAPWLEFPKELRFLSFVACLVVAAWKSCRAVWPRRARHVRRPGPMRPPLLPTCRTFPLSKVSLVATLFLFLYPCFPRSAQVQNCRCICDLLYRREAALVSVPSMWQRCALRPMP
jgi:hypothetical protein